MNSIGSLILTYKIPSKYFRYITNTHTTTNQIITIMTRTNKWTVHEAKANARYFTRNGNFGESPNSVKREGSGKGNWGKPGDEINDLIDAGEIPPIFNKQRRGSNNQQNEHKLDKVQNREL